MEQLKYKITVMGESREFVGTKLDFLPSGKTIIYNDDKIVAIIPVNGLIEVING